MVNYLEDQVLYVNESVTVVNKPELGGLVLVLGENSNNENIKRALSTLNMRTVGRPRQTSRTFYYRLEDSNGKSEKAGTEAA